VQPPRQSPPPAMARGLLSIGAMVVSALVVTLPADPIHSLEVLVELARDPRLAIGEPVRDRVPVVAETTCGEEWWDTLLPAGTGIRLVRISHTRALAS
jgi:hypothetical protein